MKRTLFSLAALATLALAGCEGSPTDTVPGGARFDGVDQQIIRLVEVDRLDDALVAVLTFRAVVTRADPACRTRSCRPPV